MLGFPLLPFPLWQKSVSSAAAPFSKADNGAIASHRKGQRIFFPSFRLGNSPSPEESELFFTGDYINEDGAMADSFFLDLLNSKHYGARKSISLIIVQPIGCVRQQPLVK